MKILFLVFHGFDAFNGISKKIGYQIEALRILGHQVELGSLAVDERGRWKRMGGDRVVEDLGAGIVGKLKKRWRYGSLCRYIVEDGFDFVYMRSDHNANPFTIRMARRVRPGPHRDGDGNSDLSLRSGVPDAGAERKNGTGDRPYLPARAGPPITRCGDIQ